MTILPALRKELGRAASRLDRRPLGRFRSRSLVIVPVALAALGGLAFAATKTFEPGGTHNRHRPFASSQYRHGHCPGNVVDLGPGGLRKARLAALAQGNVASPGRQLRGAYVTGARVVTKGSPRSADAERCGLLGKTVIVDLHLPTISQSASLSEGAVYVSRIQAAGAVASFLLWGVEH
jgi:hypothetical protein